MQIQTLNLQEIQIDKTERTIISMCADPVYKEYRQQKFLKKNEKGAFWKRQFQAEATGKQMVFDGIFGIILPVVCFFFDPLIFRGNSGAAIASEYKPFAYILSFVSIMGLLAFMLWGKKLKWLNGFLCGLFIVGTVISLVIGIALFPLSLLGLMVLIGVLGFTPLFTSFVYWRNSVRAYKTAQNFLNKAVLARALILAAMYCIVVPALLNVKIQNGINTMRHSSNPDEIRRTARRLKYAAPLVDFNQLKEGFYEGGELDNERNRALAESYKMLTGKEI